jgi:hypothetical protein
VSVGRTVRHVTTILEENLVQLVSVFTNLVFSLLNCFHVVDDSVSKQWLEFTPVQILHLFQNILLCPVVALQSCVNVQEIRSLRRSLWVPFDSLKVACLAFLDLFSDLLWWIQYWSRSP